MLPDINDRTDLIRLVNAFYDKVKIDEQIGHFFAHVNWDKHLPVMYDFWENTIFYSGSYMGNPIQSHQKLHFFKGLSEADFERWITLFVETVNSLFNGNNAELAKQRAYSIATVMKLKILHPSTFSV
ncbi:MAG: group III truncated hemoglobin [Chitinophagaceae bacterium]